MTSPQGAQLGDADLGSTHIRCWGLDERDQRTDGSAKGRCSGLVGVDQGTDQVLETPDPLQGSESIHAERRATISQVS
jgi:hypothetical protein